MSDEPFIVSEQSVGSEFQENAKYFSLTETYNESVECTARSIHRYFDSGSG